MNEMIVLLFGVIMLPFFSGRRLMGDRKRGLVYGRRLWNRDGRLRRYPGGGRGDAKEEKP